MRHEGHGTPIIGDVNASGTRVVLADDDVLLRTLRCRVRLGPDSILALAVFGLGLAGLFVPP